jgi:4-hydroxythreonine-4-phosphate dehydrogenase
LRQNGSQGADEAMTSAAERAVPVVALAMGDPAGISPELTARLVADRSITEVARLVVIADRRVLDQGARVAGVALEIDTIAPSAPVPTGSGPPVLVDLGHLDPSTIRVGEVQEAGGRFALENYKTALACAVAGAAQAVCFTPFNKSAMRLAHPSYEDEIVFAQEALGLESKASEFNVLPKVWNARVTSHVPLSAVASRLTRQGIGEALALTDAAMRDAGYDTPRIGVAALNPHAGDNGNFGREEIDIIAPAVSDAKARGIACDGPFPSDTVFVRAMRGQFDAVLTMYHDQGQIAMKLIGFDEGVTVLGGLPFPVATPAHGTAYDIAGRGVANPGASRAAVLLAARMGRARLDAAKASMSQGRSTAELRKLIAA